MRLARRGLLAAGLALPGPARAAAAGRVVSLDLLLTECLLSLDIVPAALANLPLYRRLVALPAIPEGVPDLGPQQEPNLEFLQALRPELILAPDWQRPMLGRLQGLAPVAWLPAFATDGRPLDHAQALLRRIAALTGRAPQAEALIAAAAPAFDQAAARLSGWTRPVVLVRFNENARHMAVFSERGMVGAVARRLGLRNAWQGRSNAAGVTSAGIEALAGMPEATIIHFDRGAETARALRRLAESPFWQALPAVQAGRVLAMPVIYPSGGVFSAIRFAGQLADLAGHG